MSTADKTLRLDRTQLNQRRPDPRSRNMILAVVAGLLAALLAYWVIYNNVPSGQAKGSNAVPVPVEKVDIVVASQDILPNVTITSDMVKMKQVPKSEVPNNAATASKDVVGKVTTDVVAIDQPVVSDHLTQNGTAAGMDHGIPIGTRAVSIPLDPSSGVQGWLKPGNHVDIFATFDKDGRPVTRLVLQDIYLEAVGASVLPDAPSQQSGMLNDHADAATPEGRIPTPKDYAGATVRVTLAEAQKLIMVSLKTRFILALRPEGDHVKVDLPSLDSSAIFGMPTKVVVAPPPPQPKYIAPGPVAPTVQGLPTSSIQAAPVPKPAPVITVIRATSTSQQAVSQ
jgi:pilus assembly protein CpaB